MDFTLYDQLGVERSGPEERPVFDEATMETNGPGVYVVGTATGWVGNIAGRDYPLSSAGIE